MQVVGQLPRHMAVRTKISCESKHGDSEVTPNDQ